MKWFLTKHLFIAMMAAAGALVATSTATSQVHNGDLALTTQAEVDGFVYTVVTGSLRIEGTDITNLNALSTLTRVGDALEIWFNPALTDLSGLSSLETVEGWLYIRANDLLTDLSGLGALAYVGGTFKIIENKALTSLVGPTSLTTIDEDLFVYNNRLLVTAAGFTALASIGGQMDFTSNRALKDLDGFSALNSVGDRIRLLANWNLENLDGLSALTTIGGMLEIRENFDLANLDGLSALTTITETLYIINNPSLVNIDGLWSVTSIGLSVSISNNALLENLDGLSSLDFAGGIGVRENQVLSSIVGLAGVTSAAYVNLYGNPALPNLEGLSGITELGNYLYIAENASLSNIDGLSGLTLIGNADLSDPRFGLVEVFARIKDNPALSNLDGLSSFVSLDGDLEVTGNHALTECAAGLCGLLTTGYIKGSSSIAENALGCNSIVELESACSAVGTISQIWPDDGAKDLPTTIILDWDDLGPGIRYDLQVSSNEDFSDLVHAQNHPNTEFEFVAPVSNHSYYWRVRAVIEGNAFSWSGPQVFHVGKTGPLVVLPEVPVDRSSGVLVDPTFVWTIAPQAASYRIQVSETPDFRSTVVDEGGFYQNTFQAHGLSERTTYYWRVGGEDIIERHTFTAPIRFTTGTIGDLPSIPDLSSPGIDARDWQTTLQLHWHQAPNSDRYDVQVALDPIFNTLVLTANTNRLEETFVAPLVSTTYYWRVRSIGPEGSSIWSEIRRFTTGTEGPLVATDLSPVDGSLGVPADVTLSWSAAPAAKHYRFQLSGGIDFAAFIIEEDGLIETKYQPEGLENDRDYYWRVAGVDSLGRSTFGPVHSFMTLIASPDAVTLVLPDDGATGVSPFASLSWRELENVSGYHVQLGDDTAFTAPMVDDSTRTASTFVLAEPLGYSTTYYWRVRGARDDGLGKSTGIVYGPWSETRSFTVAVGTATEDESTLPTEFALHQNYPNPFNPSTTIRYDLPEAAEVRLAVFDVQGRLVDSLVSSRRSAGRYAVTWQANGVPSGVYFVRMEAGSYAKTRSVVLIE